jgi:hypothetical protein
LIYLFAGVERHFQQYFSYIMVASFIGGGNQRTRKKATTSRKEYYIFNTLTVSGGRRGRDRMVVGFTITYAISA